MAEISNLEALHYPRKPESKVHLWNAATKEEKYAQNEFIGRIAAAIVQPAADAAAAALLDWEIDLGDGNKTSLRTALRWLGPDFAAVKAGQDALSVQIAQTSGGITLSEEQQKAIYKEAVKEAIGTYEVRKVEAPEETK